MALAVLMMILPGMTGKIHEQDERPETDREPNAPEGQDAEKLRGIEAMARLL